MTLNLGTAAYMAPELSSLTKWVRKFGTDDDTDVLNNSSMGHQEKENVLADKHIQAVNAFDLSIAKPSSDSHNSSCDDEAVRTSRDLAPKVTNLPSLNQHHLTQNILWKNTSRIGISPEYIYIYIYARLIEPTCTCIDALRSITPRRPIPARTTGGLLLLCPGALGLARLGRPLPRHGSDADPSGGCLS